MPQLTLPPTAVAFLPPFGFSCLDAIAGYMINVIGMSAFQFMAFRNVGHLCLASTALS